MIEEDLKQLGLADKEAKIYFTLIKLGASTASDIAKESGENRTTVYSVLSRLIGQELVTMDVQDITTYYLAESPQKILEIVSKQKENLDKKDQLAKKVVKELQPLYREKGLYSPRVKIFVGDSGIRDMLVSYYGIWIQDIVDNSPGKIGWGYRKKETFSPVWQEWFGKNWSMKEYKLGVRIQALAPIKHSSMGYEKQMEVKALPKKYHLFDGALLLCGDYIIMFHEEVAPPFGFMIRDHTLAQTIRSMLQFIWDHV